MGIDDWMRQYRDCVRDIWNTYFAGTAGWDERCLFLDADVALFRGIVLAKVGEFERMILPAYRGDREPIQSIRVKVLDASDVLVSGEGTFRDTRRVSTSDDLNAWILHFFSLYDVDELGHREFRYVRCAAHATNPNAIAPKHVLVPFHHATFWHHPTPIAVNPRHLPGYWLP